MSKRKITVSNKNNIEAKHKSVHDPYEYYKYATTNNDNENKLTKTESNVDYFKDE